MVTKYFAGFFVKDIDEALLSLIVNTKKFLRDKSSENVNSLNNYIQFITKLLTATSKKIKNSSKVFKFGFQIRFFKSQNYLVNSLYQSTSFYCENNFSYSNIAYRNQMIHECLNENSMNVCERSKTVCGLFKIIRAQKWSWNVQKRPGTLDGLNRPSRKLSIACEIPILDSHECPDSLRKFRK